MCAIAEVKDILGMVHRTHTGIMGTFVQFLREKSDITVLDDHCVYELGKKKVNVYPSSLRMKVPDHVYVFGSLLLQ
jgi:hypothetical protein